MTIRYGTIVKPWDPGDMDENGFPTCSGHYDNWGTYLDIEDICIGIVTNPEDSEQIRVKWLNSCKKHKIRTNGYQSHEVSKLWEIGQIQ